MIDNPCKECNGDGRIKKSSKITIRIPAGVDSGARLRSTGNGEAGILGGTPGDLYCVLHVKDRTGRALVEVLQVEYETATLTKIPATFVTITAEQFENVAALLEKIEDDDDVQDVYSNLELSES